MTDAVDDLTKVLLDAVAKLDELGIPYMVTGSKATLGSELPDLKLLEEVRK